MRRTKDDLLRAVETAVLEGRGVVDRAARRAAYDGDAAGELEQRWVRMVHERAWTATDEDVAALRQSGLEEDAIFELTLAAALGASARRLRLAIAAMESAPQPSMAGDGNSPSTTSDGNSPSTTSDGNSPSTASESCATETE